MKIFTPNIRVPVLTPVCAGSSVPDDWQNWQIKEFREIRGVSGLQKNTCCVGIPVNGDSLAKHNIVHGDILITKITQQYEPGKLCVWQTPYGRTAKWVNPNEDGSITLHNKDDWEQRWHFDEIKLIGIVVRVERDLE